MRKFLLRFATVAALATGGLLAQSPPTTPSPGGTPSRRLGAAFHPGRIIRALNLSVAQKEQARAIFQQARQSAQPVRQQLQQNRQMLKDSVTTGQTVQMQQLATQQGTLHGQIVAIRAAAWSQFLNLLTPDQRAQAAQIMQ